MKASGRLSRFRTQNGVTLIELGVVIAVFLLLIALVAPAVRNGLTHSKHAQCTSRLRQLGLAIGAYQGENQGAFPVAVGGYYPEVAWNGVWFSPVTASAPHELGLAAYAGGKEALLSLSVCPLYLDKAVVPPNSHPLGYPYVLNYFVMPSLPKPICRITQLPQPSKIAVMMDSVNGSLWGYGVTGNLDAQGAYRIQESHFGTANVLWADGHVSASKKADLKYYNINHEVAIP